MTDTWNPEQYHRLPRRAVAAVLRPARAVEPVDRAARVADLGCGTGELTARGARRARGARETVGIDTSAAMLAEATQLDVDGLTFREGDLAEFSDADGFDVIISNAALHWVPDHARVLARWRDALTERRPARGADADERRPSRRT